MLYFSCLRPEYVLAVEGKNAETTAINEEDKGEDGLLEGGEKEEEE